MSYSALLRAVRDELAGLADYDQQVGIEIDENGPATHARDPYLIVTFGSGVAGDTDGGDYLRHDYVMGFNVVIARRAPKTPGDQEGNLWTGFRGATDLADGFEVDWFNVRDAIHMSREILQNANALVAAERGGRVFVVPPRLISWSQIRRAPATIFAGAPGGTNEGYIQTMRFGHARRMEQIADTYTA